VRVRSVVALVVLSLVAAAAPFATAAPPVTPPVTPPGQATCDAPLACGDDLAEAQRLEERMSEHLWYGLALPIDYRTDERVLGDIAGLGGAWGDAGLWSGAYLAAESYRYAVARDKERGPRAGFWKEQKAQAKARIDSLLSQVDLRVHIATSWQPPVSPTVGGGTPPAVALGGVFPGEAGMMMYSCAPDDAPADRAMSRSSDVRGPFTWKGVGRPARLAQPDGEYICEASTTRDAYAGTFFGLLNAFDLVGPDDPEVRDLIRDDILAMANLLLKYGWNYPHPHGEVAIPPFGDVYDNIVTPIMVISPAYRLLMSLAAKHVAETAGPAAEAVKWRAVWTEELATQTPSDAIAEEVNDPMPTAGYFSWNLAHLVFSPLLRLTTPTEGAALRHTFSIVDRQTSDDANAFFETVTYGMGGEPARLEKAIDHLRQWRDYRARLDAGTSVNNTAGCGTVRQCVPQDEFDLIFDTPTGEQRTTVPGSSDRLRSVELIPVKDRVATDFLWQRSPFTEMDGGFGKRHVEPGIDYLLPYWMIRYLTEVDTPALNPLPVYPGPRYSGS
jgi:hypothetical protein